MGSHIPENLEGKDFKFEKLEQKQFLKRGGERIFARHCKKYI
jgi:hypothetical protein